jgi:hypothetical protein
MSQSMFPSMVLGSENYTKQILLFIFLQTDPVREANSLAGTFSKPTMPRSNLLCLSHGSWGSIISLVDRCRTCTGLGGLIIGQETETKRERYSAMQLK